MNDHEIIAHLRKENGDLKLELAKVVRTLKMESDSTTKHIKKLYERIKLLDNYIGRIDKRETDTLKFLSQHIADLADIVAPIEQKIFPDAKKNRDQLASIIGKRKFGADGKNWDKKKD